VQAAAARGNVRTGGLAVLGAALAVSATLWYVQPIASGRAYELAFETSLVLFLVWLAWSTAGRWSQSVRALGTVAAIGSVWSAAHVLDVDGDAEVVRVYRSLFSALDRNDNPYTCDCIPHVTEHGLRLGNFNYPPGEIWPYRAASWIAGQWDVVVFVLTLLALGAAALALLWWANVPELRRSLVAFSPFVVFWELRTNVATTLVVVAAITAILLVGARDPRPWHRPALWALFGLGILTKFVVVPLFAVWWWSSTARRATEARAVHDRAVRRRVWRASSVDLVAPLGTALLLCIPFGVVSIVRETVLFNLSLDRRDDVATFYPNVLSGPLTWAGLDGWYPVVAVALLGGVILAAPLLPQLTAMLVATTTFLLVAPTPEPQYVPVVVLLLVTALADRERRTARDAPVHGPPIPAAT
jgi:hypothetical protein